MPFEFGAINKERTLHTEIAFEDTPDLLPLDFYPGRIQDAIKALQALKDDPASAEAKLRDIFLSVVASWDVTSNDEPVPLTPEGLASIEMPSWRMTQILSAIVQEVHVGEATGTRLRKR